MNPPTGGPSTGAASPGQVRYAMARIRSFFSVLRNEKSDTRTGVLVEYGPTAQIFEDPHDDRTKAYVTGRMG